MKTLLILRHAKSGWETPGVPDHDRPLSDRGKRDAPRMGELLKQQGLVPDRILSSTAKRARKTAKHLVKACGFEGAIETKGRLYLATPDVYYEILRSLDDDSNCVMVVGHNPGLEDLVVKLTGQIESLSTAALAHITLEIDSWSSLKPSTLGTLKNLWRPRELDS